MKDAGEEFRRIIARRRKARRGLRIAMLVAGAAVPLALSIAWRPPVALLWNASASAPVGLYRVRATPARRGAMVVAWTPGPARSLAATRRYLPANVPLVKRVAGVAGDRVCADGDLISINGRRVAIRRMSDAMGRPLPRWRGCQRLTAGEYFLLMDSPLSFDGRYFGVTRGSDVIGRAELLWAKPAKNADHG